MKEKQADMSGSWGVCHEDLFQTQLCSQSPQPSCVTNLWPLPWSLTWGFVINWRADERLSHPAVHSASGHGVPEGQQSMLQMHEVHLWLCRAEGESQLQGLLHNTDGKISLGHAWVTVQTVAGQGLKHLQHACLQARAMPPSSHLLQTNKQVVFILVPLTSLFKYRKVGWVQGILGKKNSEKKQ